MAIGYKVNCVNGYQSTDVLILWFGVFRKRRLLGRCNRQGRWFHLSYDKSMDNTKENRNHKQIRLHSFTS